MKSPNPKVVVTDWTFPDLSVEERILKAHGVEFEARQCKTEADLIDLCADADAVVTQFARVNANVVSALRKARAIVRYGIGVDNVDVDVARARGIPVCNVPDYCIDEVADQTLAFILATTRQVLTLANHLRGGKWGLAIPLSDMKALRDLTVGIVGFGRIGREVVKRLMPFKCALHVFDPVVPAAEIEKLGARAVGFEELLNNADVLTLHCPSTPQTRRLMNSEAFATLKQGAIFINVGRGDLADPDALTAALQSGHLGAAALDVFDPEPIPENHPLRAMSNVLLSPHIASCSVPAVKKLRESVANLALAAVLGQPLLTVVNGVK
ncbi:MAG: C-terminal binding protein [Pedosphaera sp.]|nr:C-terminal binding protein [Pedosphaera sp.]